MQQVSIQSKQFIMDYIENTINELVDLYLLHFCRRCFRRIWHSYLWFQVGG